MSDSTVNLPSLVGSHKGFNLVAIGSTCLAVPQAIGTLDLTQEQQRRNPGILTGESFEALRQRIDGQMLWRWFDPLRFETPLTEYGLPEVIEIEPIHTCNLRCVMCHVSYEQTSGQRLELSFLDHMDGLQGKWAKLGSLYEPVAHPQFAKMVSGLAERGLRIDLITNGTLFTPRMIDQIKDAHFDNVTISFDGIRPQTYERIRRGADYAATLERIRAFKTAVQRSNPYCRFQINYTVTRSNIPEISEAVSYWEGEGFDHIGFIGMVKRDDNQLVIDESIDDQTDTLQAELGRAARTVIGQRWRITLSSPLFRGGLLANEFPGNIGVRGAGLVVSDNPEARLPISPSTFFQNGSFPGMHVGCRSPFKFTRILYSGDVYLCYVFPVGNIYKKQLTEIWDGQAAEKVRREIRNDVRICHGCDYFKYCIKANEIDYQDPDNFVTASNSFMGRNLLRAWRHRKDFYDAVPRHLLLAELVRTQRWSILNRDLNNPRGGGARKGWKFARFFFAVLAIKIHKWAVQAYYLLGGCYGRLKRMARRHI